ncbi:hypothetical protein [Streptomyces zaomyceticus]|uniref:hypothetical protein n=1 Tax=Streptomyces zaomyceticus TaxID=68286 RepID=UPI003428D578
MPSRAADATSQVIRENGCVPLAGVEQADGDPAPGGDGHVDVRPLLGEFGGHAVRAERGGPLPVPPAHAGPPGPAVCRHLSPARPSGVSSPNGPAAGAALRAYAVTRARGR